MDEYINAAHKIASNLLQIPEEELEPDERMLQDDSVVLDFYGIDFHIFADGSGMTYYPEPGVVVLC